MPVGKEGRTDLPESLRVKKGWCGYRDLPIGRGTFRKVLHLKTSRARKNKKLKICQPSNWGKTVHLIVITARARSSQRLPKYKPRPARKRKILIFWQARSREPTHIKSNALGET